MNLNISGLFSGWLGALWAVTIAVIWIVFSCAIWRDAAKLEASGTKTKFVSSVWWFLLTLFFSLPAAAFYWAIHHSTLARTEAKQIESDSSRP